MTGIQERLVAARAEVERLEREAFIAARNCTANGHVWKQIGGRNCGCRDETLWSCSVPVHQCEACGDWDYGDNAEATEITNECAALKAEVIVTDNP